MTEIVTLTRRGERPCLTWLLPGWFVLGTVLGSLWPGHGWQLFSIGALPGVWVTFLIGGGSGAVTWLVPTLLGGLPIVWLLGRLLDRLSTDWRLWLIVTVVAAAVVGYVLLQRFNDLDVALEHHGSFGAYFVCAMQLGSYAATLLLLALGAGRGARK
jgi:hypothetical protein